MAAYSLQVLLPDELDGQLRRWATAQPRGTWPTWGGHLSLLADFETALDPIVLAVRLERVCRRFHPFEIHLPRVVLDDYWGRPGFKIVMLMPAGRSTGGCSRLCRLRISAARALGLDSSYLWEEAAGHRFTPHLSLTWGVPVAEAVALVEAARIDAPTVRFNVDAIWLLGSVVTTHPTQIVRRIQRFRLGSGFSPQSSVILAASPSVADPHSRSNRTTG
ncbi:MAG: 2'-5' RNA ligase family protein [Dehalococcoidia bacterium]